MRTGWLQEGILYNDVHVIHQVNEKFTEYNQHLYMAFIDYENAFDSVEVPAVMEILRNQGVQEAYLNILVNIYRLHSYNYSPQEKWENKYQDRGQARRHNPSNAIHCMLTSIRAIRLVRLKSEGQCEYHNNLLFADDIVLFSNTGDELQ